MPWVIWDILLPLLVTFLIGLGTGWLLWRWRRQRADIAHSQSEQSVIATQPTDDSANTILIRERDDALERAVTAEAELQSVKNEYEFSIPGVDYAVGESTLAADTDDVALTDNSAEIESLNRELEQEKSAKAELDRTLLDLNSRYKQLSTRLEEAVNNEEAQRYISYQPTLRRSHRWHLQGKRPVAPAISLLTSGLPALPIDLWMSPNPLVARYRCEKHPSLQLVLQQRVMRRRNWNLTMIRPPKRSRWFLSRKRHWTQKHRKVMPLRQR